MNLVKKLKDMHSYHYSIQGNNIFTQPVNYTVKLTDIVDSILYHKGLYDTSLIKHPDFKRMFFIFKEAKFIEPNTHPLLDNTPIIYSKCILEIWSIDEYLFKDGPFKDKNLPFKIKSCHRVYDSELFNTRELSENEALEKIKLIKKLVNCPILIVGPYLSLTQPTIVNDKRKKTQKILKNICKLENLKYFDMTHEIEKDNTILISAPGRESHETHFTEKGQKIINEVVYNFFKNE